MKYDLEKHHRRSIRLKDYDYSRSGAYFVTICTQGRTCLFGDIEDGRMMMNEAGAMVERIWEGMTERIGNLMLDEFVVMPNHVHGVVVLGQNDVGAPLVGALGQEQFVRKQSDVVNTSGDDPGQVLSEPAVSHLRAPTRGAPTDEHPTLSTLGEVVGAYKSITTMEYIRGVKQQEWTSFAGRLWQRNYFERVIRDDEELSEVREYIDNNPLNWEMDEEHPNYATSDQQRHAPAAALRRR